MNITIKIQEREAIPIRALPFVAGFEQFSLVPILPPYLIAMSAGMPNDPGIGNSLATFTIENREIRQLDAREWGAVIEHTDKPLNDAVRELPAGVFVFTDEFASWFKWLRQADDQPFDPERFQIHLNPLVPDALHGVVMAGFGEVAAIDAADFHAIQHAAPIQKQAHSGIPSEIVSRKLNVMVAELEPIWPNIQNDINNGHKNGLRAQAKLSKHGKWNMTAALKWAIENRPIKKDKAATIVASDPTSELSVLLAQMLNL